MNEQLRSDLAALLDGPASERTARLAAELAEALAGTPRHATLLADPNRLAALLDGALDEAARGALLAELARDPEARAEAMLALEAVEEIAASPTRPPAGLLDRAQAILAPKRPAAVVSKRSGWWSPLAWNRGWTSALSGAAALVAAIAIAPVLLGPRGPTLTQDPAKDAAPAAVTADVAATAPAPAETFQPGQMATLAPPSPALAARALQPPAPAKYTAAKAAPSPPTPGGEAGATRLERASLDQDGPCVGQAPAVATAKVEGGPPSTTARPAVPAPGPDCPRAGPNHATRVVAAKPDPDGYRGAKKDADLNTPVPAIADLPAAAPVQPAPYAPN